MHLKRLTIFRKKDSEEHGTLCVTFSILRQVDQQYTDQDHHETAYLQQGHVFACKEYAQQYSDYRVYISIGAHLCCRPDL